MINNKNINHGTGIVHRVKIHNVKRWLSFESVHIFLF